MSRYMGVLLLTRLMTAAVFEKYRETKKAHDEHWADKQVALVLGFGVSAFVSVFFMVFLIKPGWIIYGLILVAGLVIGFAIKEQRRWFLGGAAIGSMGLVLMGEITTPLVFVGAMLGAMALIVATVIAVSESQSRIRKHKAILARRADKKGMAKGAAESLVQDLRIQSKKRLAGLE